MEESSNRSQSGEQEGGKRNVDEKHKHWQPKVTFAMENIFSSVLCFCYSILFAQQGA